MEAENLIHLTIKGIEQFLYETFGETVSKQFSEHVKDRQYTWESLRNWILQNPLENMYSTILSFAQTLPQYESFESKLKQSLTIHDVFWNKVYSNFCLVKHKLTS